MTTQADVLSMYMLLPIIAVTTLGNLLWIPFDKGNRWLRFWRAVGFFVFSFLAIIANTAAATEGGNDVTTGDVVLQIVFVALLAFGVSFVELFLGDERSKA